MAPPAPHATCLKLARSPDKVVSYVLLRSRQRGFHFHPGVRTASGLAARGHRQIADDVELEAVRDGTPIAPRLAPKRASAFNDGAANVWHIASRACTS